ncbi:MAG: pyridoxamine 5'-phosphate oxidase family protein [Christensenellales bacterium]
MSRPERIVSKKEAMDILEKAEYGCLSMVTPDGHAYGVAVNHCYLREENIIYFHCAVSGLKIDCLKANPNVSFFAVSQHKVVPERFITHYESALAFGKARIIIDSKEIVKRLKGICDKFAPHVLERRGQVIAKHIDEVVIVEIGVESITGKRNSDN